MDSLKLANFSLCSCLLFVTLLVSSVSFSAAEVHYHEFVVLLFDLHMLLLPPFVCIFLVIQDVGLCAKLCLSIYLIYCIGTDPS